MKEITVTWKQFTILMDYVDPNETIQVTLINDNKFIVNANSEIIDSYLENNEY